MKKSLPLLVACAALLLGGCALTRPPLACHGPLQPINVQTVEKSHGST